MEDYEDCPGYDPMSYSMPKMRNHRKEEDELPKMEERSKEARSPYLHQCSYNNQYSSNQGIGDTDPASMILCGMLGMLFICVILLFAVAGSNALFCNFMGVRDDGQYILCILGAWGVILTSIIYIWYLIDTQSDSK